MSKSGNKVKETKEERELAKIAMDRYQVYRELYAPQIDRYISRVRKDDGDRGYARAEANSSMGTAFRSLERNAVSSANPQVSMARSTMFDPRTAMANANQFNDIDSKITDMHYRGLESVAKMGQGIQTSAVQGMTDIARSANQDAVHNAMQAEQRRAQNISGAMSLAGAGFAAMNKPGVSQNPYGFEGMNSQGLRPGTMPQHIPGNPSVTPMDYYIDPRSYFDYSNGGKIYG